MGKAGAGGMTVAFALNEAQRSTACHRKLARVLNERLDREGAVQILRELAPCVAHLMLVFQKDTHVERAVRFVVTFVTSGVAMNQQKNAKKKENGAEASSSDNNSNVDDESHALIEGLLCWLSPMTRANEKSVRFRACQLIAGVVNNLSADVELADDLLEVISTSMRSRLRDKVPQVRAQAARALARLQEAGDEEDFSGDAITIAFKEMIGADRNKEVRKIALASMAVSQFTLDGIIRHTRDMTDSVRRIAYGVLASKVPMETLTISQRYAVLKRGLSDRIPAVKSAAVTMLKQWFEQGYASDCVKFLEALDVEAFEDESVLIIQQLFANNLCSALDLAESLPESAETWSLRNASECSLSSELALIWRVICETISSEAKRQSRNAARMSGTEAEVEAAEATKKLDRLEKALPSTPDSFLAIIRGHVEMGRRFATRQLLTIASQSMELADATSRNAAAQFFFKMISETVGSNYFSTDEENSLYCQGSDGKWERALVKFGVVAFGNNEAASHISRAILTNVTDELACDDVVQFCFLLSTLFETIIPNNKMSSEHYHDQQELLDGFCVSCIKHESVAVRREAVKLMGGILVSQIQSRTPNQNEHIFKIVLTAFENDHTQVKKEAAKFFMDLSLLKGPKFLGRALQEAGVLDAKSRSSDPFESLRSLLDDSAMAKVASECDEEERDAFSSMIIEGFAKLLIHNHKYRSEMALSESEQSDILTKMIFQHYFGASKENTQQLMSVFFDIYSGLNLSTYRVVCSCVVPVVKQAFDMGMKARMFNNLTRFLTELIAAPHQDPQQNAQQVLAQEQLCLDVMCESVRMAKECKEAKQIVPLLLKLIPRLAVKQFSSEPLQIMDVLTSKLPAKEKKSKEAEAIRQLISATLEPDGDTDESEEPTAAMSLKEKANEMYHNYVQKVAREEDSEDDVEDFDEGNDAAEEKVEDSVAPAVVEEQEPPIRRVSSGKENTTAAEPTTKRATRSSTRNRKALRENAI